MFIPANGDPSKLYNPLYLEALRKGDFSGTLRAEKKGAGKLD
jgi:hypothetical protein